MSQVCCFAAVLDGRNIEAIARAIIIAEQAILGGYKYLRLGVVRLNINSKSVLTLQRGKRILHIRNQKKLACTQRRDWGKPEKFTQYSLICCSRLDIVWLSFKKNLVGGLPYPGIG